MKICLQLVTWNNAAFLPSLFDSLKREIASSPDTFHVAVWDNASTDTSVEIVKQKLSGSISFTIKESKENIGFSGGHNALFRENTADVVVLVNPDIVFTPGSLSKLPETLERHPEYDVFTFALHRQEADGTVKVFDSLGLEVHRSRRVTEIGTGRAIVPFEKELYEVFGVSGALMCIRAEALKAVAYADGSVFDEAFGTYKEDVDLAFRFAWAGYKSAVLTHLVAYHTRTVKMTGKMDILQAVGKRSQSPRVRLMSYRNHLFILFKNEDTRLFLLDSPWIIWYEMKKFIWQLGTDPKTVFVAWGDIWRKRQYLRDRRQEGEKKRKITVQEMEKRLKLKRVLV